MARIPRAAWSLDPADVRKSVWGNTAGARRKAAHSRSLDLTAATIALRHDPTGIEVRGEVPQGHYSRVRMRELRERLTADLFAELERLVAARLRVAGR